MSSKLTIVFCGIEKLCRLSFLLLNLGNEFLFLKNLVNDLSKFSNDACKDCEFTSFSQDVLLSFLSIGSSFCISKRDRPFPVSWYDLIFLSKA